tara:strand:+ start:2782 stop:3546 length:765 start_codon:yes stop_codon:yes gene_type:complete
LDNSRTIAFFHDEERSDLFFIRLNEYISAKFNSPLNNDIQTTVLDLILDSAKPYYKNKYFKEFIDKGEVVKKLLFKKRYYKYHISPHLIDLELSLLDLIFFQANYSKHSFYHLNILKKRLKDIFRDNDIENFAKEDYNYHLETFKEAVLDDRLNFNQTNIIEKLGDFFLAYWDLLNSPDNLKTSKATWEFIQKNGRLAPRNIPKPENLNEIEEFHWQIRGLNYFKRNRISDFIPKTPDNLIEKETSPENRIVKI